jgi:predicted nucleic acid-binding protein
LRVYWDTSALVEAIIATPEAVAAFEKDQDRITRVHTLAETFSQLTKGTLKNAEGEAIALLADDAAKTIEAWAGRMKVISLDGQQVLTALKQAQSKGVRGGAVHDYLHIFAAEAQGADKIYTLNISDFAPRTSVSVTAP